VPRTTRGFSPQWRGSSWPDDLSVAASDGACPERLRAATDEARIVLGSAVELWHGACYDSTTPMPKLTIRSLSELSARKLTDSNATPARRPCPRCRVVLEPERSYVARGLTGTQSTEHRFRCPACDARYHFSSRTNRWRELAEEPV